MLVEYMSHMLNEPASLEYQRVLAEIGRLVLMFDGTFDGAGSRAPKPGKRSLPLHNSCCVYS